MTASIFISFASKDHKTAETICNALENRGFRCWISNRDVLPGHNYQESISRAIRSAKVMLLVFTANANNSDEIKKELALASRSRLVVIPLRVEDVVPNDAFDYEFATRQWIDLFDGWEEAFKTLTAQIATIVPPQLPLADAETKVARESPARSEPGAMPAAQGEPRSDVLDLGLLAYTYRTALFAAGLAVLVAVAGYYLWHRHTADARPETPPPVSAPASPQSPDPFPHRRAGLWEQHTIVAGAPAAVSKLCMDQATEAVLIGGGAQTARADCPVFQSQTVGTATISDATCKKGDLTVSTHTVGTFVGDTQFHLDVRSHSTGVNAPLDSAVSIDGTWTGACPANMKPGDLMLPNGQIVHLTKP